MGPRPAASLIVAVSSLAISSAAEVLTATLPKGLLQIVANGTVAALGEIELEIEQ